MLSRGPPFLGRPFGQAQAGNTESTDKFPAGSIVNADPARQLRYLGNSLETASARLSLRQRTKR